MVDPSGETGRLGVVAGVEPAPRRPAALVVAGLVTLAWVVGWPTLHGDFSSGDDVQLVAENVLVNHPSLAHAIKLFRIPAHRDLYQPLPLLTFQIDFAIGGLVSHVGDPRVVHVTNISLHALNSVLVFLFLRQLTGRFAVAALAGMLMAVHPLNVESIAWINGRMMLLSTALCLAGLMAWERWHARRGRWGWLAAALLLFLLTMITKVRVELPGLLMLPLIFRGERPGRRWFAGWAAATAITLAFSLWAVQTTRASEMFEMAEEEMAGPRLARAFQTLAWYLTHYVVPTKLGPWHPPVPVVAWGDADILRSTALVLVVLGLTAASWRAGRTGVVGMLWFLGAIFSTLPLIASRAILAGERYTYLPAIGLHWITAAGIVWIAAWLARRVGARRAAAVCGAAVALVAVLFVRQARAVGRYYETSLTLAHRIIELYPEQPDVFVDLAWAYIRAGRPDEGIRWAQEQFQHGPPDECLIYQAIAWAHKEKGELDKAEHFLLEARKANPEYSKVYYRLAEVYVAQGRLEKAEADYRRAIELTPLYLPAQAGLGHLYLRLGRAADAERVYREILEKVNPYHPQSRYNLGEIALARGDYAAAQREYEQLLAYMPEHAMARTNLGVCLLRQGDAAGALAAWERALRDQPGLLPARLNRAALLAQRDPREAERVYRDVLAEAPALPEALEGYEALLQSEGRGQESIALWEAATRAAPDESKVWTGLAWVLCRGKRFADAVVAAERALRIDAAGVEARLALGLAEMGRGETDAAESAVLAALRGGMHAEDAAQRAAFAEAADKGLDVLMQLSEAVPGDPWPYYFSALVLASQGRDDAARAGLAEFEVRGTDQARIEHVRENVQSLLEPNRSIDLHEPDLRDKQ